SVERTSASPAPTAPNNSMWDALTIDPRLLEMVPGDNPVAGIDEESDDDGSSFHPQAEDSDDESIGGEGLDNVSTVDDLTLSQLQELVNDQHRSLSTTVHEESSEAPPSSNPLNHVLGEIPSDDIPIVDSAELEKAMAEADASLATLDPQSQEGFKEVKAIDEARRGAFLGYGLIIVTSDDSFGKGPTLRRSVFNPRIPKTKDLSNFYKATNYGQSLLPLDPQHAITIAVDPRAIISNLSGDPLSAVHVEFHPSLAGKDYNTLLSDPDPIIRTLAAFIPIVVDGAHRIALMQTIVYYDSLVKLRDAKAHLDLYHNTVKTNEADGQPPIPVDPIIAANYLAALKIPMQGVWLARFYDIRKIEASPHRGAVLLNMCANTPIYSTKDKEDNLANVIFNTMNTSRHGYHSVFNQSIKYIFTPSESTGNRIRTGFSNFQITSALANLARFPFFLKGANQFSVSRLSQWNKIVIPVILPYLDFFVLFTFIITSTHENALQHQYPEDGTVSADLRNQINFEIQMFQELPFDDKDVHLHILNDEFFQLLTNINAEHFLPILGRFGLPESAQSKDDWKSYCEGIDSTIVQTITQLTQWAEDRKDDFPDDDTASQTLLDQLEHRLKYILLAQVFAGTRLPRFDAPTPIPTINVLISLCSTLVNNQQGILQVLNQFEPLAFYELRSNQHSSLLGRTFTDIVEELFFVHCSNKKQPPPSAIEVLSHVCTFTGVLIQNCHTGLAPLRLINTNPSRGEERPPLFIEQTLKTADPHILDGMNKLAKFLGHVEKRGLSNVKDQDWMTLMSVPGNGRISKSLLTLILTTTNHQWQDSPAFKGPNRSNNLIKFAKWVFIAAHHPYTTSAEPMYHLEGYEAQYFRNEQAYKLVSDLISATGIKTWHEMKRPDIQIIGVNSISAQQPLSDLRQAHGASATHLLNNLHRYLTQSPLMTLTSMEGGALTTKLTSKAHLLYQNAVECIQDSLVQYHGPTLLQGKESLNAQDIAGILESFTPIQPDTILRANEMEEAVYFTAENLQEKRLEAQQKKNQPIVALVKEKKRKRLADTSEPKVKRSRSTKSTKGKGSRTDPIDIEASISSSPEPSVTVTTSSASTSTALTTPPTHQEKEAVQSGDDISDTVVPSSMQVEPSSSANLRTFPSILLNTLKSILPEEPLPKGLRFKKITSSSDPPPAESSPQETSEDPHYDSPTPNPRPAVTLRNYKLVVQPSKQKHQPDVESPSEDVPERSPPPAVTVTTHKLTIKSSTEQPQIVSPVLANVNVKKGKSKLSGRRRTSGRRKASKGVSNENAGTSNAAEEVDDDDAMVE
ncbi:hypothetical protein H0H93_002413, partial [Arthromyces matolae]